MPTGRPEILPMPVQTAAPRPVFFLVVFDSIDVPLLVSEPKNVRGPDLSGDLLKRALIHNVVEVFPIADPEMRPAVRTNAIVLIDLFPVDRLVAPLAFDPEILRYPLPDHGPDTRLQPFEPVHNIPL